ncbi:testis-expressed protein 264 [Electrophorus electricus]|uniref:Testis expressed 264, ER-phagy receptor a n=1 Tax=Electrophorus electricus TaxID=8005 RepID=A0A4W4HRL1_ELEEL|nr:testis-expressed protein 264 [Electrophorus electricus]
MSDFVILTLILFLVICLILTVAGFLFYSGLLSEIVIRTGSPPVKKLTIAYKFKKGSYKDSGTVFTESCSICPKLCSVGVYYDDPNQTQADCCRYAVGSILSECEEKPDEELQRLYEKFGFRVISFPEVSCAVSTSFPNRCPLSPICGAYRVYPELSAYITERRLSAYPFLEICKGDVIHYMCPVEDQKSFFVPELIENQEKENAEDEKDNDVTETGESREIQNSPLMQEACAEIPDMAGAPISLHQNPEQDEGDAQSEEGNQGTKGSSESVDSGSSFEELDMDMEEEAKEKKDGKKDDVEDNEEKA